MHDAEALAGERQGEGISDQAKHHVGVVLCSGASFSVMRLHHVVVVEHLIHGDREGPKGGVSQSALV